MCVCVGECCDSVLGRGRVRETPGARVCVRSRSALQKQCATLSVVCSIKVAAGSLRADLVNASSLRPFLSDAADAAWRIRAACSGRSIGGAAARRGEARRDCGRRTRR